MPAPGLRCGRLSDPIGRVRRPETKHPILYEINVRPWLAELSAREGRTITLAGIPGRELDRLAGLGIDLVWLMGVWETGPLGVRIARSHPGLEQEYRRALPDFTPEDVIGSPYSIARYTVSSRLGGPEDLANLRRRLAERGIGLVLDFVVNHTGVDAPWVRERPELYVHGTSDDLRRSPHDFFAVETVSGPRILAHGKDPYFPGWTDTVQLDLLHPETREVLRSTLDRIADQCDGVRCDMAMLALDSVFRRTWGDRPAGSPRAAGELWTDLAGSVRTGHPGFLLIAEVYWGIEADLRSLGIDYTYDKTLYDRLAGGSAETVRRHLDADPWFQLGSVRFLENHDEPRAAAVFPWHRHRAAAVVAATLPGMVLLHEGQLEGRRVHLPVQLRRRPPEPVDPEVQGFYGRLLEALKDPVFRQGDWRLLQVRPAWEGNPTWEGFLAWEWSLGPHLRWVAVNLGSTQGQCYIAFDACDHAGLRGRELDLRELLGGAGYRRGGSELLETGLYLDLPPSGFHTFAVEL